MTNPVENEAADATPNGVDRIRGAVIGLLVGDALGVPYEFHPPQRIPAPDLIEMTPPPGFRRAHSVPAGTWSDDGAQSLCLMATLAWCGRFDVSDFANRIRNWANVGYLAVDGEVFDIGNQTRRALSRLEAGVPPLAAGPAEESDNGNGSLMRVLPLALWHGDATAELCRDALVQSQVTHGHARSRLCCALLCLIATRLARGEAFAHAWTQAAALLEDGLRDAPSQDGPTMRQELLHILDARHAAQPQGSGYVLDSLWSARACLLDDPDYQTAVRRAISLGNDTDTTACIVGGLSGLVHGERGIPQRWRDALRGRDLLDPLLDDFIAGAHARI